MLKWVFSCLIECLSTLQRDGDVALMYTKRALLYWYIQLVPLTCRSSRPLYLAGRIVQRTSYIVDEYEAYDLDC